MHKVNSDLSVIAPHDATAASEQQRELVGDVLVVRHGELRAAGGDVPNDATDWRRPAVTIDLSEIMNFVSLAVPQFSEWIPRLKETHLVLLPWLQRATTMATNL